MDKRSLIFVFALTVVLMFTHQYFDSKRKPQVPQKTEVADVSSRVAQISSLPLTQVKASPDSDHPLTWAVAIDGEFLTLAWTSSLPEQIYVQEGKRSNKRAFLEVGAKSGQPVLYTTSKDPSLSVAPLSQMGHTDLQLISVVDGEIVISLAEYQEGTLSFPGEKPTTNGIALVKVGHEYLPAGFYIDGKLTAINGYPSLKNLTVYEGNGSAALVNETFYVLENTSMQVVFSTSGGAIAEINLPFTSESNDVSVIRPIGFDKRIRNDAPKNALFPLQSYLSPGNVKKSPTEGGYYPLLRRGIVGEEAVTVPNQYYALNLVSSDGGASSYTVTNFTETSITFEGRDGGRRITKTYSFPDVDAPYTLNLDIKVQGNPQGLYLTSGVPEVELISGSASPILKYRSTAGGKPSVDKIKLPKTTSTNTSVVPDWVSNSNGFFGLIVDPLTKTGAGFTANMIPGVEDPTRLILIDHQHDVYPASKFPGYEILMPIGFSEQSFRLFAGPYDTQILKQVDAAFTTPSTGYTPDYIACQSFHGWFSFISEPFAKFLMLIMNLFYKITHSWGISIILITIVLRLMLYPLNAWSIKSQLKMQAIAPQISAIEERYKKEPKKAQLEKMQLFREKGVNPFTGCIPLLIQMPFLIGMFDLLKSSFELRGASFIPGWIDNLTAPDVLFSWSTPIFFFGTSFHLLPILVGGVMFIQQKYTQLQSANKGTVSDQQKQQQKMGTIMTIVFTFIFYNFPSGLNLYWLSSIGLGIIQQWYTGKKFKVHAPK